MPLNATKYVPAQFSLNTHVEHLLGPHKFIRHGPAQLIRKQKLREVTESGKKSEPVLSKSEIGIQFCFPPKPTFHPPPHVSAKEDLSSRITFPSPLQPKGLIAFSILGF